MEWNMIIVNKGSKRFWNEQKMHELLFMESTALSLKTRFSTFLMEATDTVFWMHLGLSYTYLILPLFPSATIIYSLAYIQYSWITITYHIKPHIYVGRLWKYRHVFIFCLLMFIKHTDTEADKTMFAIKIGNAVQQMRYLTRALIYIYIYI